MWPHQVDIQLIYLACALSVSLTGVQSCHADSVELDSAAVLLCGAASEGERSLF